MLKKAEGNQCHLSLNITHEADLAEGNQCPLSLNIRHEADLPEKFGGYLSCGVAETYFSFQTTA